MFKPLKLSELVSETNMYSYPIDYDLYNPEEVIKLVEFYALVEDANVVDNRLKKWRARIF